jgi:hypothetical protein
MHGMLPLSRGYTFSNIYLYKKILGQKYLTSLFLQLTTGMWTERSSGTLIHTTREKIVVRGLLQNTSSKGTGDLIAAFRDS